MAPAVGQVTIGQIVEVPVAVEVALAEACRIRSGDELGDQERVLVLTMFFNGGIGEKIDRVAATGDAF